MRDIPEDGADVSLEIGGHDLAVAPGAAHADESALQAAQVVPDKQKPADQVLCIVPVQSGIRHRKERKDTHPGDGFLTMLQVIDQCRGRILLSQVEHAMASNRFTTFYYALMIPSIVISSFLAVVIIILPPKLPDPNALVTADSTCSNQNVQALAACLNAFNTVLLGLAALMKFQSKMDSHRQAASECKKHQFATDQLEARLTLFFLVETPNLEEARAHNSRLIKDVELLDSKLEEIAQLVPLTEVHTLSRKALTKIYDADVELEAFRRRGSPGKPLRYYEPVPESTIKELTLSQEGHGHDEEETAAAEEWYREQGPDTMLEVIDQCRGRILLMQVEHSAAANHFRKLYYLLMVPSIVISSFLAVISLLVPPEAIREGATLAELCQVSNEQKVAACLNAFNTILQSVAALTKFGAQMESHTRAASECKALKFKADDLESKVKLFCYAQTPGPSEIRAHNGKLVKELDYLHSKLEEISNMVPLSQIYGKRAVGNLARMYTADQRLDQVRKKRKVQIYQEWQPSDSDELPPQQPQPPPSEGELPTPLLSADIPPHGPELDALPDHSGAAAPGKGQKYVV